MCAMSLKPINCLATSKTKIIDLNTWVHFFFFSIESTKYLSEIIIIFDSNDSLNRNKKILFSSHKYLFDSNNDIYKQLLPLALCNILDLLKMDSNKYL